MNVTRIDVVMITKNSFTPSLKTSVQSIIENVPLARLIVVDAFSEDNTINFFRKCEENGLNLRIIQRRCGRGKARELGINKVSTDWFAFVDSDVILPKNWFKEIRQFIGPEVGAIEGNVKNQIMKPHGRAYTNCTLIKTLLVKDIQIPSEIHVFEDQFIRKYIENKGYFWLKAPFPVSIHRSQSDRIKDAFEIGRIAGKYRLFPLWRNLVICLLIPIKYSKNRESPFIYLNRLAGNIIGILERWNL